MASEAIPSAATIYENMILPIARRAVADRDHIETILFHSPEKRAQDAALRLCISMAKHAAKGAGDNEIAAILHALSVCEREAWGAALANEPTDESRDAIDALRDAVDDYAKANGME